MYFLQEAILGGMMLMGAVVLTIAVGFALLACFIYWFYKRTNNSQETARNNPETIPVKKAAGALAYIIIALLVIFVCLLYMLLNFGGTTYE